MIHQRPPGPHWMHAGISAVWLMAPCHPMRHTRTGGLTCTCKHPASWPPIHLAAWDMARIESSSAIGKRYAAVFCTHKSRLEVGNSRCGWIRLDLPPGRMWRTWYNALS